MTAKRASGLPNVRIGKQTVQNEILLALPKSQSQEVLARLEYIDLPVGTVLNEAGEKIKYAFFVNSGLASVLGVFLTGKSVEVGLAGKDGFVGLPLAAGLQSSHTKTVMQVAGSAFRVKAADLLKALKICPELARSLNRYQMQVTMQASQVAACNRTHSIERRLARWLLMSQDRLGGEIVPLTQEFLSHMLGTRRASVTVAAGMLERAGATKSVRRAVIVVDRSLLERASCECYRAITNQTANWLKEESDSVYR